MDNQELVSVASNSPSLTQAFGDKSSFEHAQRVAKMIAQSDLVPARFKGNIQNVMIALEMANRLKAAPLMVMQNLYVVHGSPAWSGQFVIAAINACGKFHDLEFDVQGAGESLSCVAFAEDKRTGRIKKGAKVTFSMAKAEGWVEKTGSKWETMPEQMIMYRAASFFGRIYCPDVLMGMYTVEEIQDYTELTDAEMDAYIFRLIEGANLDEDEKDVLRDKVAGELSESEAWNIVSALQANQLDPVTHGKNYNATDIAKHISKLK